MKRRHRLGLFLLIVILAGCSGGSGKYDTNTEAPKGDPAFPALGSYWVIDMVGTLKPETFGEAQSVIRQLRDDNVAEVVVVIANGIKQPEAWATHYGRYIGLGKSGMSTVGGNNGVVWLIRPDASQRLTVEPGRGLPKFTTIDQGKIVDEVIGYFNTDHYDEGVLALVIATDKTLRTLYPPKGERKD